MEMRRCSICVLPREKVTLAVVVWFCATDGLTVAVKVTCCPGAAVAGLAVSVSVVATGWAVRGTVFEVLLG